MKKYNVSICGHFGGNENFLDGQTIKTKTIADVVNNNLGYNNVYLIDTYRWKSHVMSIFKKIMITFTNSKNIVILPGQNGLRVFAPLLGIINKIFKRKLFYIVIGGWLPEYLEKHRYLAKHLKNFDRIFVETTSMKSKLELLEFKNISVMPNFKRLRILNESEIRIKFERPLKLCTFSRVMREKGIEDAIEAVRKVNSEFRTNVYELDIYGQIDKDYETDFRKILKSSPDYINYKGVIPYEKSVDVLKEYYLLLFPTYYEGEGFPGTLLDALASGLPVLATEWRYNTEIITEGKTGRLYPVKDLEKLTSLLIYYVDSQEEIIMMRKEALKYAINYMPKNVIKELIDRFEK